MSNLNVKIGILGEKSQAKSIQSVRFKIILQSFVQAFLLELGFILPNFMRLWEGCMSNSPWNTVTIAFRTRCLQNRFYFFIPLTSDSEFGSCFISIVI